MASKTSFGAWVSLARFVMCRLPDRLRHQVGRRDPLGGGGGHRGGASRHSFRARSRSLTFWILPELVIGNSSTNTTWRGGLKLAPRPRPGSVPPPPTPVQPRAGRPTGTAPPYHPATARPPTPAPP